MRHRSSSFSALVFTQVTLGHCRFPLYIPQKIGQLDTWDVTFGSVTRSLHPGMPPASIDMISDVPRAFVAGKKQAEGFIQRADVTEEEKVPVKEKKAPVTDGRLL
jgi:hypothetical protein